MTYFIKDISLSQWKLSNGAVWNISGYNGVIIITDSDNKVVNSLMIPVYQEPSISITDEDLTNLYPGYSKALKATVSNDQSENPELIWSSDNESVATVDSEGNVTAKTPGDAVITVALSSNPDISASININVLTPSIYGIQLINDYIQLTQQDVYRIETYCQCQSEYGWENYDHLVWSSSNESVATVSQDGVVTAVSPGVAQIKVQSFLNQVEASATVMVNERIPDYSVSLQKKTAYRNSVYWIPLELTTKTPILGLQCDLRIGEGCEFAVDGEKYNIEMNDTLAVSHNAVSNILDDGKLRIICTSPKNQPLYEGQRELFYIPVRILENAPEQISFKLSNVVISKLDSFSDKIDGCESTSPVLDMTIGDLNGDGELNVADVTGVISVIMGNKGFKLTSEAADYDNDGIINVMDIVKLIDDILNQKQPDNIIKRVGASDVSDNPEQTVSPLCFVTTQYERGKNSTLDVALNDSQKYIAAQFDIVLPEHLSFRMDENAPVVTLDETAAPTHSYSADLIQDNVCRIVVYSLNNSSFHNSPGFVSVGVNFDSNVDDKVNVEIKNIQLIDCDRKSVVQNDITWSLTEQNASVDTLGYDDNISVNTMPGSIMVTGLQDGISVSLYDIDGRCVGMKKSSTGMCMFDVDAGIYIIRTGDLTLKVSVK